MNPVDILTLYVSKIHFNIIVLFVLMSPDAPTNILYSFIPQIRRPCSSHCLQYNKHYAWKYNIMHRLRISEVGIPVGLHISFHFLVQVIKPV
jgi:hypothetical protein